LLSAASSKLKTSVECEAIKIWESTWDQTVRFAYVSSLWEEGKQRHKLCKPKNIIDTGNETANYKVLPMGNNVYSMDSICFFILCPSTLSDPLAF
jgi:hypothetical protein